MLTSIPIQWQDDEIVLSDSFEHQSRALKKILKKMLQIEPEERYQTAELVIDALNKLDQSDFPGADEDATTIAMHASKPKPLIYGMYIAIACILLFNTILIGIWHYFFPEQLHALIDELHSILQ